MEGRESCPQLREARQTHPKSPRKTHCACRCQTKSFSQRLPYWDLKMAAWPRSKCQMEAQSPQLNVAVERQMGLLVLANRQRPKPKKPLKPARLSRLSKVSKRNTLSQRRRLRSPS